MFSQEGKLVYYGTKLANLMLLQLLVILTCLPVVTIGPALSAMHTLLLRLVRDEEDKICKAYFAAFRSNFRQGLLIWLGYLAVAALMVLDYGILAAAEDPFLKTTLQLLIVPLIFVLVTLVWVFILQSRYDNPIFTTLKNSLMMFFFRPFLSIGMLLLGVVPLVLPAVIPTITPVVLLLGITLPGYLCAMLYSRIFDKLEGVDRKAQNEEA